MEAAQSIRAGEAEARQLLRRAPRRIHNRVDDSQHERKELYHYLCDSALPLATAFLANFYQDGPASALETLDLDASIRQQSEERRTLAALLEGIRGFASAVQPCLSSPTHLKTLIFAFRQVAAALSSSEDVPGCLLSGLPQPHARDPALLHRSYLAAERDLNAKLNIFAHNASLAYGGTPDAPLPLHCQLSSPADKAAERPTNASVLKFSEIQTWGQGELLKA